MDEYTLGQINLASDEKAIEKDGLIWKEVLKTGKWATTPDLNQQPVDRPFIVNRSGDTIVTDDQVTLSLEKLKEAYDEGAIDHVTVPETHADSVLENTGHVRELRIDGDGSDSRLMAGIEFTEPEVAEKAKRGTIPNTSCGILFDYMNKQDKKTYPAVLGHVALTPKPWINGLAPFGAAFSEELPDGQAVGEILAFSEVVETEETDKGGESEVTEPEVSGDGGENLPEHKEAEVEELVEEEKDPLALAQSERRKQLALADESPAPNHDEGGEVHMDETEKLKLELSELKTRAEEAENRAKEAERKSRQADVEKRVIELSEAGLKAFPGFLKEARQVMLSDDGGPAVLMLSEKEGETPKEMSATQIVESLIDSLPKKDDGVTFDLSEQALIETDTGKPEVGDNDSEDPLEERLKKAQEFLDLEI